MGDEGSRLTNSQIPRNHPSSFGWRFNGRSRTKSISGVGENALFSSAVGMTGVLVGQNILHVRSREKSLHCVPPLSAVRAHTGEEIRGVLNPWKRSFSARGPEGQREPRSRKQTPSARLLREYVTGSVMRMQSLHAKLVC